MGAITAVPVFAETAGGNSEGITMSPVSRHYELDAGNTTADSLKIINSGDVAYDFIVYGRPYTIVNSDYLTPNYGDEASKKANADVYKWAEFDQDKYHLEPGQSVDVPYRLNVPKDASPGGHYGVLFAETQSVGDQTISRNKRVGSVMYVNVKGDYTKGVELTKPSTSLLQINPPLAVNVSAKNTGNSGFVAKIDFKVFDIFGGEKYSTQVEQDVLPDSTRASVLEWRESPSFGLFKVRVDTAALDKTASMESYVFMAPFWFYGFIAILVVGGVMYAVARRKR